MIRRQRQRQRQRRRQPVAIIIIFFFVAIVLRNQAQAQEPQCQPQEPTKYDWERFNYYELLGLSDDDDNNNNNNGKKKKKKRGRKKKDTNDANANANAASEGGTGEGKGQGQHGAISNKEIRKAYRKQAQKYHPDKQASKKKANANKNSNRNSNSTSSSSTSNSNNSNIIISIEESTARFAKIAEAYEFLLDDTKRKDYDLFLEYCDHNSEIVKDDEENEGRIGTMLRKRFAGLFDDFVGKDPFRVFEEFFFGGDNDNDNDNDVDDNNDSYFDPNDPFSHLQYGNQQQQQHQHQEDQKQEQYYPQEDPVRVFNEQQNMYDPVTGENVVRVLQTEEFAPTTTSNNNNNTNTNKSYKNDTAATGSGTRGGTSSSSSSSTTTFYYRIVAQDFKERYDPYTAKQVLVPITEPYLQEDGHRKSTSSPQQQQQQQTSSTSPAAVESILHSWEVLTPDSRRIVSPNGRYVAGLSPDCELLIMIDHNHHNNNNHDDDEYGDDIMWSTKRPYGNNGNAANNCFAVLKGPHLVVTVGQHPQQEGNLNSIFGGNTNTNTNRILWHSDGSGDEDDSQHGYYEYEDEFGFWHKRRRSYLAQLDNDGSLTVYSVWSVPQDNQQQQQQHPFSSQYGRHTPKAKAVVAKAINTAKDMWHGRIDTKEEYGHLYYNSYPSSTSLTYKRCVYSTSRPLGCYRIGRKLTQISLELYFRLRRIVSKMNHVADAWLDLIYEEDDIFYDLKESILKNTNAFGSKMVGSSARFVRKVLERFISLSKK